MRELAFKKGLYKYYSPWLYKLNKLRAAFFILKKGESLSHLQAISQFYWNRYLSKKFRQELLNENYQVYDVNSIPQKIGEKAFILGCGGSINLLTEEDWQVIKLRYSVGLNNFYIHQFVPDAYFCEFLNNQKAADMIYSYLLDNPDKSEAKVHLNGQSFFSKGHNFTPPKIVKPCFYFVDKIKTTNKNLLAAIVRDYFTGKLASWRLSHQMSNLETAVNHLVKHGVKKICLVGIDLNSAEYFWDVGGNEAYAAAVDFRESISKQLKYVVNSEGKHATAAKDVANHLGNLPVVEYLQILQHEILTPLGVQLFVANPNSLLADFLPVCNVSEFQ